VVLLCGGDKRTQDADVNRAIACKTDFLRRMKENRHDD
jgi:putative component of toxin-antitoxin plasmid stabilization module